MLVPASAVLALWMAALRPGDVAPSSRREVARSRAPVTALLRAFVQALGSRIAVSAFEIRFRSCANGPETVSVSVLIVSASAVFSALYQVSVESPGLIRSGSGAASAALAASSAAAMSLSCCSMWVTSVRAALISISYMWPCSSASSCTVFGRSRTSVTSAPGLVNTSAHAR